jgi:hypothetical protein
VVMSTIAELGSVFRRIASGTSGREMAGAPPRADSAMKGARDQANIGGKPGSPLSMARRYALRPPMRWR